jgi:hypothetical protein
MNRQPAVPAVCPSQGRAHACVSLPDRRHLVELLLKDLTTLVEVNAAHLKIVGADANRQAQREPPAGQ